eukprot:797382-Pelagomonas_calceolata.AAC.1
MQRTAACAMTAIHCWQVLQSGPLCGHGISVGSRDQCAGKALSAKGNSHPAGLVARGYVRVQGDATSEMPRF